MFNSRLPRQQFMAFRLLSAAGLFFFWVRWFFVDSSVPLFWRGFFPPLEWNSLISFFPNILLVVDRPLWLAGLGLILSVLIGAGFYRKFFSSLSIYILACFHHSELMTLTPLSLLLVYLLIELMTVPQNEHLPEKWKEKRWHAQAAGVILLFMSALLINPFALPERLMGTSQLTYFFPLWLHVAFSLSFLILPIKPWRWVFWCVEVLLIFVLMLGGIDLASILMLLSLLVLSIDPRWFDQEERSPIIVFYDGTCGLCHGFVRFLLEIDEKEMTHFSALQSEYAQNVLQNNPELLKNLSTVAVISEDKIYVKSEAAFEVFKNLGGLWTLLSVFRFLPKFFTDLFYDFIAKRRYRVFGKLESCPLPDPNQKQRFIESYEDEKE